MSDISEFLKSAKNFGLEASEKKVVKQSVVQGRSLHSPPPAQEIASLEDKTFVNNTKNFGDENLSSSVTHVLIADGDYEWLDEGNAVTGKIPMMHNQVVDSLGDVQEIVVKQQLKKKNKGYTS